MLASSKINGSGQPLAFRLRFNPDVFPVGGRVELRGRATQSGQLILHLPSVTVTQPTTQAMGQLQFGPTAICHGPMNVPLDLQRALATLLGDARLTACALPGTDLRLWLIDAENMDRAFTLQEPPYWSFCWASGLAMARYLAERPQWVAGKRVLDFGAGSAGIAGIAAAKAGALEVVACDLDPLALAACQANAALNGVTLNYSADFFAESDRFDLILVADVLYDRENLPLLDQFLSRGREALVADSRVRDFRHPQYQRLEILQALILQALTLPDLMEPQEFRQVSLYHASRP